MEGGKCGQAIMCIECTIYFFLINPGNLNVMYCPTDGTFGDDGMTKPTRIKVCEILIKPETRF